MICFVTGTRPSSIKVQSLVECCKRMSIDHTIWNTNQHQASMQVFDMTGDMFKTVTLEKRPVRFANMILEFMMHWRVHPRPRLVVVVGDTDSALAAAMAADMSNIPVAHVEAGVRSFYRMPEEVNRIAIDTMSTYLFAPTTEAMTNLAVEHLNGIHVGNIMVESLLRFGDTVKKNGPKYILIEMHRKENDDKIRELSRVASVMSVPVKWITHPRYDGKNVYQPNSNTDYLEPRPYKAMTALVANAALVITDSGGLQVDAAYLNVPCLTLRQGTEWGCTLGSNIIVKSFGDILSIYEEHMNTKYNTDFSTELWDDHVSERIMEVLV